MIILSLRIRCSHVYSSVSDVSLSPIHICSGSQKRTVYSLINEFSSKIKMTYYDSSKKREVKEPVCMKPIQINNNIPMKDPLFRGLLSSTPARGTDVTRLKEAFLKSSTEHLIPILNQLKDKTSLTSTSKVRLPQNVVNSILDQTFHHRDVSTVLLKKLSFKNRFESLGFKSLDLASSMNRNIHVLHRKVLRVPEILSDGVLSPCFQSDISLFVTLFIGIFFQEDIFPSYMMNNPFLCFSPFFKTIKELLYDVYVNQTNMCRTLYTKSM